MRRGGGSAQPYVHGSRREVPQALGWLTHGDPNAASGCCRPPKRRSDCWRSFDASEVTSMHRRTLLASVTSLAAVAAPRPATSQPSGGIARIGWLTAQQEASLAPYLGAFRSALAGAGL